MTALTLIVIVLAFVCELLATFSVQPPPRVNFMAAGLMLYFATLIPGLVR